jgi:Flp pilus assembly protein TadD
MGMRQSALFKSKLSPESNTQNDLPESQLLEAIILARATFLARKGELAKAEELLIPLTNKSDSRIEALDLLGKIYAQRGEIEQAQTVWLQALQREPSNLHFLGALQMCARCGNSRFNRFVSWPSGLRNFVVFLLLVALAVVVGLYV